MSLMLHHIVISQQLNLVPAPTMSFFTPTVAESGEFFQIFGSNFINVVSVTIGGVSVPFTVNSPTNISITLPANAASGSVVVTTVSGSVSQSGFTFFVLPKPTTITPSQISNDLSFSWSSVIGADSYDWFAQPDLGNPSAPIGSANSPYNTTGTSTQFVFQSFSGYAWLLAVRARKNDGTVSQYKGFNYTTP